MGEADKWVNNLQCSKRELSRDQEIPRNWETNFSEELGSLHIGDDDISTRSIKILNKNPR